MSKDTGGTAFPITGVLMVGSHGMTLRDYFAAQTLADINGGGSPENLAKFAYEVADAMIAERAK